MKMTDTVPLEVTTMVASLPLVVRSHVHPVGDAVTVTWEWFPKGIESISISCRARTVEEASARCLDYYNAVNGAIEKHDA